MQLNPHLVPDMVNVLCIKDYLYYTIHLCHLPKIVKVFKKHHYSALACCYFSNSLSLLICRNKFGRCPCPRGGASIWSTVISCFHKGWGGRKHSSNYLCLFLFCLPQIQATAIITRHIHHDKH